MGVLTDLPDVKVSAFTTGVRECDSDFLAVPVFEQDDLADIAEVDAGTGNDVSRALSNREFRAKPFEIYPTRFDGATKRVLCVGAGPRDKLSVERMRKVATAAGWAARQRGGNRVAMVLRGADRDVPADARAVAEGLVLAALGADRHKTSGREAAPLQEVAVVGKASPGFEEAVRYGALAGRSTNIARWLSDEPGNRMTPRVLADAARTVLEGTDVAVDVLDEQQMADLNMGMLLGVGKGSAEPPRLIVMRYSPASGSSGKVLGLVGKGVTFDTGGVSLKTAEGMEKMKHDMSGGAAVIGAMKAIAELKPAISVIGVVPTVENMPSDRALKPGDIVVSAAGKTVEVINTDAEGRLILGDALWYARREGATHLVDVATLTGACVIALGKVCSGLFGGPDSWIGLVQETGARLGERYWRLPADDDYKELLKSEYADMTNSGGRAGGAIAGAMFLREFAGGVPWAHLDVAGTAWTDDPKPWQPKGATGVTVRTLIELAVSAERWPVDH
jgi:leucyl aminopeptidase